MPSFVCRARRGAPVALWVALAGLSGLLPACHDSRTSRIRLRAELEQARARWADAGLDNYAVTQRRICFCPPPHEWTVVVLNGQPSFIDSVVDPIPEPADRAMEQLALDQSMSVEELFDWIEDQLGTSGEIDVTFDPDLGYPVNVSLDPILQAVDDEIGWALEGVTPTGACTEIGCTDLFLLTVYPPSGGFAAGDWTVTVANGDNAPRQCSFRLAPGTCGGGLCVENATCGVVPDPAGAAIVLTLPGLSGPDPVGVLVEIDGAEALNVGVEPAETRLQPNGPLCPPVCWTAAAQVGLP